MLVPGALCLYAGTEAGGAGHHLCHQAHGTELDDIVGPVAQFAVLPQFVALLVWRSVRHTPGAGVHQNPGLLWNHNLHVKQVETGQDHHPGAPMERKAWYPMAMVLPTQVRGEIVVQRVLQFGEILLLPSMSSRLSIFEHHLRLWLHAGIRECHFYGLRWLVEQF